MYLDARLVFVSLLAISAAGQVTDVRPAPTLRNWADAREYNLGRRASEEPTLDKQFQALLEWDSAYPKSEFERERTAMFVHAYKRAGKPEEAFARAAQSYKLHPKELGESMVIAGLAPLLPTPTAEQVALAKEAASDLLDRASEFGRAAAADGPAAKDDASAKPADPDSERVLTMIRDWRKGKPIHTAADFEREVRELAETALAWVKTHSN